MTTTVNRDLNAFAVAWFEALDRHDDIEAVLPMLVDDGLELRFPEGTQHGHAGFREWYSTVTNRFFDEVHELTTFEAGEERDGEVEVHLVVNWQAKIWNPPAARSEWLGFDATQTWVVRTGDGAPPRIVRYIVDRLDPMPGSASL